MYTVYNHAGVQLVSCIQPNLDKKRTPRRGVKMEEHAGVWEIPSSGSQRGVAGLLVSSPSFCNNYSRISTRSQMFNCNVLKNFFNKFSFVPACGDPASWEPSSSRHRPSSQLVAQLAAFQLPARSLFAACLII